MALPIAAPLPEARGDRVVARARGLIFAAALCLFAIAVLALVLGYEQWPRSLDDLSHLLSETTSLGLLLGTWILVAGLGAVAALLRRTRSTRGRPARIGERGLVAGFALFAIMMLLAAGLQVQGLQRSARADQGTQQVAIARLKAEQVDAWTDERFRGLHLLAASLRGFPLEQVRQRPEIRQLVDLLLSQFLAGDPERVAVGIFQPDGTPLATVGDLGPAELAALALDVRAADQQHRPAIGPLRSGGTRAGGRLTGGQLTGGLSLPFVLPMRLSAAPEDRVIVVSVIDPTVTLLRRFGDWPGYSATGEVELVARVGDRLVHIVSGRNAAASPPLAPVGSHELGKLVGASQGAGTWEAVDRHGNEVVAASYPVRQLPWIVIARTDRGETAARISGHVRSIWAMTVAIVLFGGVLTLALDALLAITAVARPSRPG